MIKIELTEDQARAVIQAIEIIHTDKTHDSWGDEKELWEEFDYQMCLDDLVEAKEVVKKAVKS